MIEQTLVLIKPDGIQRGLIGEIIKRFEQRGLKIIGLKLTKVSKDLAKKHYTEDISKRRGEHIRKQLLSYITNEVIVAMAIEGVSAIENVRKIVGVTQGKNASLGTIRGDFTHTCFEHADEKKIILKNVVHASGNKEEAQAELSLWFSIDELHDYKRSEEEHVY